MKKYLRKILSFTLAGIHSVYFRICLRYNNKNNLTCMNKLLE